MEIAETAGGQYAGCRFFRGTACRARLDACTQCVASGEREERSNVDTTSEKTCSS
jgi:hypothetical protein